MENNNSNYYNWTENFNYEELLKHIQLNSSNNTLDLTYENAETKEEKIISIPINSIPNEPIQKNDIEKADNEYLGRIFNWVCDEYAKRLCEKYGWYFEDCFWVADLRAGVFCASDMEYSLSLEEVKLLVDNDVPYSKFVKWWDYNYMMHMAIQNNPNDESLHEVNLWAWIKGYHGDKDDEWLKKQEDLYWSKMHLDEFEENNIKEDEQPN